MNALRYRTKPFDIDDDDVLREQFMCFVRLFIPWEDQLDMLSDRQRPPTFAFIYESEVMREGHIGFLELHGNFIAVNDAIYESYDDRFYKLDNVGIEDKIIEYVRRYHMDLIEYIK